MNKALFIIGLILIITACVYLAAWILGGLDGTVSPFGQFIAFLAILAIAYLAFALRSDRVRMGLEERISQN